MNSLGKVNKLPVTLRNYKQHTFCSGIHMLEKQHLEEIGEIKMLISRFDNTNIEEYIASFEKQQNITLPEEYKRFLLKYNGGKTPKTKFRLNKVSSDVRAFYGLGNADKNYNFQELIDNMNMLGDYIEDEMLSIASTVSGDYITIGLGKEENGCIFFKYHDRGKKYIDDILIKGWQAEIDKYANIHQEEFEL